MLKQLSFAAILGLFVGAIIWVVTFYQTHENVCTDYQVIRSVEPYQKTVSITKSTYIRGEYVSIPSTETQTWYYIHLKNGAVLDRDYIDSKVHPNNEICVKWEWRSKQFHPVERVVLFYPKTKNNNIKTNLSLSKFKYPRFCLIQPKPSSNK